MRHILLVRLPAMLALALTTASRGRGKAIVFATQDSWLWQMDPASPAEDQTFSRFWRQTIRWLVGDVPEKVVVSLPTDQANPRAPMTL